MVAVAPRCAALEDRPAPVTADDWRERAFLGLPPTHRAALFLRDAQGLSYAEIGASLGLRPATAEEIRACQTPGGLLVYEAREAIRLAAQTMRERYPEVPEVPEVIGDDAGRGRVDAAGRSAVAPVGNEHPPAAGGAGAVENRPGSGRQRWSVNAVVLRGGTRQRERADAGAHFRGPGRAGGTGARRARRVPVAKWGTESPSYRATNFVIGLLAVLGFVLIVASVGVQVR